MRRAKKPTRAQKTIISGYHLKPENWLVLQADSEELHIIHRYTKTERRVKILSIPNLQNGKRKGKK